MLVEYTLLFEKAEYCTWRTTPFAMLGVFNWGCGDETRANYHNEPQLTRIGMPDSSRQPKFCSRWGRRLH